jgi:phage terminase large subunit-like protein
MPPTKRNYQEIADKYIDDVLSGKLLTCKWVKLACQRQKDDLTRPDFPYTYDAKVGEKVCRFIELCPHVEGRQWAGNKIEMMPWQVFVTMTVFSWLKADGGNRFRVTYIEVPKGSGKSTWTAPICNYKAFADGEPGSQVYSAAVSKEQAKVIWGAARQMLLNMPTFTKKFHIDIEKHALFSAATNSKFIPLAADERTSEGKNPYFTAVDELHAHPDRNFYDSLDSATGKRQGAIIWNITTAGTDLAGVCYEMHTQVTKVLEGLLKDESIFGCIWSIDLPDKDGNGGDDWATPTAWIKANPSWGVSVNPDIIRGKAESAVQIPSQQSSFKTKHLSVWCKSDTTWMDINKFLACADTSLKEEDFKNDDSVVALDLASKLDILAGIRVHWRDIGKKRHYYAFGTYWLPEDQIEKPENTHYKGWWLGKNVRMCMGATNNYDEVEDWIRQQCSQWKVKEVPHDQYQAVEIVNHLLESKLPLTEFQQRAIYFTPPMDELEAAVLDKRFHYNGDPVLAWAVSNVVCHRDRNSMLFPTKEGNANKIDPCVALLMAVGRILFLAGQPQGSGGGSVTAIGNCRKCTALCIGAQEGDGDKAQVIFLCDACIAKGYK